MKGKAANLRDDSFVGSVFIVFCVVLTLLAAREAPAEVRDTVSTPDEVQYGDGDGLDGSRASDAAITASQAFQEPSGDSTGGGGSPSPDDASTDAPDGTIETSPISEKIAGTGEVAREARITELPDTGGASPASLIGAVLVAGGLLIHVANRKNLER